MRCEEKDRGLKASTTFRNMHCVGRWVQRNILCLNHITSFNRLVLQIIHTNWHKHHRSWPSSFHCTLWVWGIVVNVNTLEMVTHVPCLPQHDALLPLIEYMTVMGVRCEKKDCGLKVSTIFCNVYFVGRWVQRNILGLDHTTTLIGRCCRLYTAWWPGNT